MTTEAVLLAGDLPCPAAAAASLGDAGWAEAVERFDAVSSALVEQHGGDVAEHTGPALVALFSDAAAALRAASALTAERFAGDLRPRAALHVGPVVRTRRGVTGSTAQAARDLLGTASPGAVLLTAEARAALPGVATTAAGDAWRLRGVTGRGPARAVVVDDHPLWRQTMAKVLTRSKLVRVVGEAADAATALDLVRDVQPDVVLLDLNLASSSGLQVLDDLAAEGSQVRVLVLSSSDEVRDVRAARRAGASGYLLKTAESRDVVAAVGEVLAGRSVFPQDAAAEGARSAADVLTPRQLEVLLVLADGRVTSAAAARRLGMSPRTLSKHLENAYSALQVSGRLEALDRLRADGLLRQSG